ncbi:MAG: hypothetical protein FWG40_01110 [Peptococcaceae bacterium]|nr:hypothetical protein [Peptococcaceae bacterium]
MHLNVPTRTDLKKVMAVTGELEEGQEVDEERADSIFDAALLLFNCNKEKIVFTLKEVEDILFDWELVSLFFTEYYAWIQENLNQKNSQSPTTRQPVERG